MTPPKNVRRFLARGLATGLLFTQSALMLSAQTTAAAPDPAKNPDGTGEVVVLEKFTVKAGFSGSLAAAAQAKQNSQSIVEVIMSEDLGKLPDISIADSLTRLTGLTTQRTNGRSQAISIRGLTGDFSTGLLNGREQVATSLNRAVEFDQYPAELLSGVVVSKTASANVINQGLAGTIDLQTVRPLSKTGRVVAVSGYYSWTEFGELTPGVNDKGYRFNLSYIDQLADGKLGIALGLSSSVKPDQGNQFQAWGYPTDAGNIVLGGAKPYVRSSNLDRDGLMGVVEWKPNDNFSAVVDFYTSDFQEKQLLRGMEIPLYWSSAALQAGYTVTNGYAASATFTGVHPVVRNDLFVRDSDPLAFGVNIEMAKKSAWPVTLDLGYSRVNRTDRNTETWSGISHRDTPFTTSDTMTVRINPGSFPSITPTKNYATGTGILLSDPKGWGPSSLPGGGMYGYEKYFRAKDELGQLRLSTKHDLNRWFKSVELGLSYTDRYKRDGEGPSGFLNTNGAVTLPLPARVGTTDFSYLGIGSIYAYDPIAARNSGVLLVTPNNDVGIVANRYDIREKLTQAYVQFEIDTKFGDTQVDGNLGLRVISTDQSSKGFSANSNTLNPVTQGDKYNQLTPSLNLNFRPNDDTVVRFSAARQVARPRMFDMRASRSWGYNPAAATSTSINNSPWSGGGGNGDLRPWTSNSFDLSFERYFKDNKGYIAVAAFTKKLTNFIYESSAIADFTGYPVNAGPAPALRQGIVTQPVNGQGGSISGLEATLSLPSEMLSKEIKGFGLIVGGAYTDSRIRPYGPTGPVRPIAGLSRKVANATLYYERDGFSARVSQRYRSESRQYITTFGVPSPAGDVNPNGGFSVAQPETVMDAQVSYTFADGYAKGLTIYLQAYNLNDEPLITYDSGDPRKVINYQTYGASYSFGASYKF